MGKRLAAKITGVAGYVPPRLLTNADLERMVDTSDEWIQQRVGIRERHIVDKGMATSHLATAAAQQVLEKTRTRHGATRAWGFDLSGACSGFVYALTIGAQFVGAGTHKKALVIGSDVMSSIIDYQDRNTCVLFGDGAGAVLLEPSESDAEGILDFVHDIDGSGGEFLCMPGGGSRHPASPVTLDQKMHYVHQDGKQVFKYAVRRMAEIACGLLERNGYSHKDVALVVPHQANLRIIRAMQERLGLDDSQVLVNIDRFANTTGGTIPLGLNDAVGQGRLKKGDLVVVVAVGAGYTAGGVLMRWAY
ncbi:MAG: 3-oxoacyl-ACP synthase [Acidobacteria bacterium]|nr:MAG: 3-oxoacyl-ACP synthase [Acidobacteriota bacterium]